MIHREGPSRLNRAGATVVETAVVLNLLLVIFLGVFEYGRVVMIRHLLTNAAREGARMAVVGSGMNPRPTTQDIANRVESVMANRQLENFTVSVYAADPSTGENLGAWDEVDYGAPIAVHVACDYTPFLPTTLGILPEPLRLGAVSMMRSEAN